MDNDQAMDGGVQNQSTIATPVDAPIESNHSAESPQQTQAEKMFTQSQMNAVAAKEARKAAERAEAKTRAEYESRSSQQMPQSQPQNIGGIQQQTPEDIQRMIRQEAYNMSREHQASQIEQNWKSAMESEKESDPEFADLYDAIGIEAQPLLVIAMAGMENKAKVVKDLAKNPSKYANILTLANGGSPKLAQLELNKLSASIKTNEEAKKQPKVDAPLSQIRASNIGGDDGNLSVTDLRGQDWLRG